MNNAQTRQRVDNLFGEAAAANFLNLSLAERNRLLDEAAKSPAIMSPKLIEESKKFQTSVADMDDKWKGLQNTLSENIVIPWLQPEIDNIDKLAGVLTRLGNNKTLEKIGHMAVDIATNNGGALIADLFGQRGVDPAKRGAAASRGGGRAAAPATSSDLDAMARAIYTEAASEGPTGQAAVAHVILNRVKEHFGGAKTISDVVNAPGQFEGMTTSRRNISTSDPRYQRALAIAQAVMSGKVADPTGGADHYLNPDLQASEHRNQPAWAPGGGLRIGRHVFYGGAATDAADPRGNGSGAQLADAGRAANGSVTVDVTLRGAPPGTIASVSSRGQGISAGVKIAPAMQGAA